MAPVFAPEDHSVVVNQVTIAAGVDFDAALQAPVVVDLSVDTNLKRVTPLLSQFSWLISWSPA